MPFPRLLLSAGLLALTVGCSGSSSTPAKPAPAPAPTGTGLSPAQPWTGGDAAPTGTGKAPTGTNK